MTGRTPTQPSAPPDDLERTAELPALDPAALEPSPAWIIARARAAAEARRVTTRLPPPAAPAVPASQLEQELAQVRGAQAVAEQKAQVLTRELTAALKAAAVARAELEQRDAQLAGLKEEAVRREEAHRGELSSRDARLKEVEGAALQQSFSVTERESEVDRLKAEGAKLLVSEQSLKQQLSEAARHAEEQGSSLTQAAKRCEELEGALSAQKSQGKQLEAELAKLRRELEKAASAPSGKGTDKAAAAALAAANARAEELGAQLAKQHESVRALEVQVSTSNTREKELESQLASASELGKQLRADLEGSTGQLTELGDQVAQLRSALEEARAAVTERDAQIQQLKDEAASAAQQAAASPPASPEPEELLSALTRLLIRTDADSEVVHVLGTRTSIGRSNDNDLQVDVTSISRHHALIVASAEQTVIEDLHSTNGVRVNGRRITRQPLKDGDTIAIGKAQFRFAVRSAA
jgi:chromosome segregation ATPase